MSLCPLQIPHDLIQDRIQAIAMGSQQLTTKAMVCAHLLSPSNQKLHTKFMQLPFSCFTCYSPPQKKGTCTKVATFSKTIASQNFRTLHHVIHIGSEFEISRHTEHCVVINILSLFMKDTKDRRLHAKSDV